MSKWLIVLQNYKMINSIWSNSLATELGKHAANRNNWRQLLLSHAAAFIVVGVMSKPVTLCF